MNYKVLFLNGDTLIIDEVNYKRLNNPRRSMGGLLYAPMKDQELVFYDNILLVIPDNIEILPDSWKDSPYVVRFTDGFTLGLTEDQCKSLKGALGEAANRKFISLRNGVLVYPSRIWFIAHRGSDFLKEDYSDLRVFPTKKDVEEYVEAHVAGAPPVLGSFDVHPVLSKSVEKRLKAQVPSDTIEVPLTSEEAEAFDPALALSCCDTNSEIRWKIGKDDKKRYMMQCTVCGKKGKMVKGADVENPGEVLEVAFTE